MAYLGNAPARSFISFERQVFTIVNSQTAYTLSHSVTNENDIRLVINNIVQEPGSGKAYTASGTTLTLSAALTNGTDEMYCVFLGRAVATNAPGAGSVNTAAIAADAVTEAKIADDAVESEHLNNNVISGQTELASEPADTDEFLVSDAGTLKRIDYSLIKGGGITVADQFRVNAGIAFSSEQTVDTNWERIDTSGQGTLGSGMSESSGIFTFPSTGIYLVRFVMSAYKSGSTRYTINSIAVTTDNSNYTTIAQGYDSISQVDSSATYANSTAESLIDVTNTSNVKVKFLIQAQSGDAYLSTSSSVNRNTATFIRLGDT
jgi:hypothetical protein